MCHVKFAAVHWKFTNTSYLVAIVDNLMIIPVTDNSLFMLANYILVAK